MNTSAIVISILIGIILLCAIVFMFMPKNIDAEIRSNQININNALNNYAANNLR